MYKRQGEGGEVECGFSGAVGDAVAAAHVELGERGAVGVADAGHQAHHAAQGADVRFDVGDLGADVAVQADEFELRLAQDAGDGVLGGSVGEGQAELLAVGAGADLLVAAGRDAGDDADQDLLPSGRADGGGEAGDLGGAVDDDPADAEP